jgi:hypothetical protein
MYVITFTNLFICYKFITMVDITYVFQIKQFKWRVTNV